MSEIIVLGIAESTLQSYQKKIVEQCELVFCGKRLNALVDLSHATILPITPLTEALMQIEANLSRGKIAVLASGDPLLYGVGKQLLHHFGPQKVTIIPALSSMQLAFSKFKIPWDDAAIVSLHGKKTMHLPAILLSNPKTFVFTDRNNTPMAIATQLLDYFTLIGEEAVQSSFQIHIAENLGLVGEKITTCSLQQAATMECSDLNVLLVEYPRCNRGFKLGLNEENIKHSRGLITKDEIRATTLHRLRLPRSGVFWDIGGGSGSISIEAASINPQLMVYTVERNVEELENIKENIRKFNCYNVIPVDGEASAVLDRLPDPNAVFIGGSGGELRSIIKVVAQRLVQGGRIVVNGVTSQTTQLTPRLLREYGLRVETSTIKVSRSGSGKMVSFNPITIMVGTK